MKEKIKARMRSFAFAGKGVASAFRSQPNAKIHSVATLAVVLAGWRLGVGSSEWCLLFLAIGLVWAAELANTAIERLVDLVSPGYHELAGKAKDSAAGGVLIAAVVSALVGIIVFLPHLLNRFSL